jgi:hypothetical protein
MATGKTPIDESEEQAKRDAARMQKIDKEQEEDRGKAGKNTRGELKYRDIHEQTRKARQKGKEKEEEGAPPPSAASLAASDFKIGKLSGAPTFSGIVTCTSRSWETDEEISAQIDIPNPVTEDGVFYRFLQYHPSARRDGFKIDTENVTDPKLRTRYG